VGGLYFKSQEIGTTLTCTSSSTSCNAIYQH